MLIQTFYAIVTGSLGLLSDSIHMLFDCLALVVGLCASVMSKWPPSLRFPYGFGKMDTLAGFANGVFLMLISVEIVYEAIERLVGGSKMQRIGELLVVSGMGLVVNLVGMLAFGHAHHGHGHDHSSSHTHDHSHSHASHSHDSHDQKLTNGEVAHSHNQVHDHSHDHSHSNGSHSNKEHEHSHDQQQKFLSESLNPPPTPFSPAMPSTPSKPTPVAPSHSHAHHDHSNENMHGIFLHVLADTLGSVAVVFSTILIHYTKWNGWDPLASCLIAILIFASAIPLVISSAKRLLLTVPANTEFDLRETLAGMGSLRGVNGVSVPRFWVEGSDIRGVMHVIVGRGVDCEEMRARAMAYLKGRGVDCLVQVEREGEGRCWCGGGVAR
jgi:zinc transporter 5/7